MGKQYFFIVLKGFAMGAANVIPGVSGGTIAFITGIFQRLINALKQFNVQAIKLLFSLKFKELSSHIDLPFLAALFTGIGLGIISVGRLLKWLFSDYPVLVWAFFFGLILASVYSLARTVGRWNAASVGGLLVGTAIAGSLALFKPAPENPNFFYLIICGLVAICSMLLPGISGSFVLILMGNYELIMLNALPSLDIGVIVPVGLGAAVGFVLLSHAISMMLRQFELASLGTLTGFVLGSLLVIWPWKTAIYLTDAAGAPILKKGQQVVSGYDWQWPNLGDSNTLLALFLILLAMIVVLVMESVASKATKG
ncbi:MAG: DUF368 domain-containing protein [Bacteroidetes bacterium]|nr:DUF368 domain-containing protein [Bacteroidota bacterium]